jgi:hypothetical protein
MSADSPFQDSPTKGVADEICRSRNAVSGHLQAVVSARQSGKTPISTAGQAQLTADLRQLKSAILSMARICLDRVSGIAEEARAIENDVKGVDGVLRVLKDAAGASSLAEAGRAVPKPATWTPNATAPVGFDGRPDVALPAEPRRINTGVLGGIGDGLEAGNGTALIRAFRDGMPRARPWSRMHDFFLAPDGARQEGTAFVELYCA